MKISEIKIKNFKRFKDLTITGIDPKARLVVIVGPNGSGKSSLFDAFYNWYRLNCGIGQVPDNDYYVKEQNDQSRLGRNVEITFHDAARPFKKECMYFRTAYRNDPDFNVTSFHRLGAPYDNPRFTRFIDNDQTVSTNYQRLVHNTLSGVYSESNNNKSVRELREELIGKIRSAMKEVFDDLLLNNIGDPLGDGAFRFQKGTSASYHYKNLSGGEKAAFDLILDLLIKSPFYTDTIFLIDEPESHIHTSLQGRLVAELFKAIPQNSQLWLTTHSLGVMLAAKQIAFDNAAEACVLDFGGSEFDEECIIRPATIDRVVWEKFLSIAVGDFSARIAPEVVALCEGSPNGNRRRDFDAEIYNRILQQKYTNVVFVSGGSCAELETGDHPGYAILHQLLKQTSVARVIDRDDRSASEVGELTRRGLTVLKRRHLESYLFDDEILTKLVKVNGGDPTKITDVLQIKREALSNSEARGNPSDDIKSAAGLIYNGVKRLLGLTRCGNNADAFMRDTLAPLVSPDTKTFRELEAEFLPFLTGGPVVKAI
jgi:predicted ATPase